MGRPRLLTNPRQTNIVFEKGEYAEAEAMAIKQGVSFNEFVRRATRECVKMWQEVYAEQLDN